MQAVWLSPNVSTTYWVDVTSPGGCVERHYIDITVNILPQASVWMAGDFGATSSTTLCLGNTLSLEGHGAGTNGSYRWMDSNGNMISTTQTINVSPTQTTTYYLEVTNEHGCIATTFFVAYVLPLANMNVSASHMVICEGGTTVLQAGFPYDNLTYIWTEPDGTQTVGHTLTVAPMQTTTYQVQTNTYEGCLTRDSITIQVVPELTAAIQGPEIVCAGDSVTLTATEGDSYLWSNGAMTQSIQVAVQAYSSYTVSVTNSAGCVAFAVHDIDVYPVTPIQIVGNDTIFMGESTTLVASGALTYFWNNGQTGSSITVAPLTTTTYQVTGYDANGCTSTKAFTVVIDRFEPNILGDEEVCLGGSVTLTADAGLNATYLWSTGETTASIQVNPGVTTTYSLSVTSQTGAIGNTDFTVVVLDLPIVDLQPTVAVCQSETEVMLNYTVNSGNPTHCNIYFDAAAQTAGFPAVSNHVPLDYGTLTIALPNGVAYGSYTIEVEFINDNGCVGNISNATINILLDNMIVLKWDDVLICDNIHHLYAEYQWYKNDRIISGASMQYYSETGGFNGEYYVVATKHDGTKHQSCPVFFQTAYAPQISMSPNPVQRFASVNLIIPFTTEELEGAYLTIHDMTGRLIEQSKEVSSSMNMPVAYPAGMYMLVVHLKDGTTKGLKFLVNE